MINAIRVIAKEGWKPITLVAVSFGMPFLLAGLLDISNPIKILMIALGVCGLLFGMFWLWGIACGSRR